MSVPHIPFTYQLDDLIKAVGVDYEFWRVDQYPCRDCGPVEYNPTLQYLYQKRNEHMVDSADLLVYYWNGQEKGGTWNTIKYGRMSGIPMLNVMEIMSENDIR